MIREQQPELSERAAAALARRHPKYGLHSLRHFFASWAIQQGFSAKRIQALMGHSSIQVTFDTYGHLLPNPADDREAMRRLQAGRGPGGTADVLLSLTPTWTPC